MGSCLELAMTYLKALEDGATGDDLAAFFDKDAVQEEFPNRLNPNGAKRDLAALLDGAERGKHVIRQQRFELLNSVESEGAIALEVQWTGILAVPIGNLPAGGEMRARFAVFIEYKDGKIVRQRNYDCFEPW